MLLDTFIGVCIAFAVSWLVCRALLASAPLDMPTQAHKKHATPTPTSGGMGVAIGLAAGVMALSFFSTNWRLGLTDQNATLLSMSLALSFGFLALGFIDDAHPLSASLKFAIFSILSLGVAYALGVVKTLPLGWGHAIQIGFWLGLGGTALWVFTLVNCVNFMDGVNGLAMGSVAIGLVTLGVVAGVESAPRVVGVAFCAAAAIAGFLLWNFPHGRLFAGDSGALFAGALASATALLLIRRIGLSPFIPPIAFFPLLADALLTLAWRARRGRSLFDGHSEHLYQIASRAGWSQTRITLYYWAAMAACGGVAFAASRLSEVGGPWIALLALAALAMALSSSVRRAARRHGIEEA